ncbi:sigma-70 family RNA polymerase sigma factor [Micromonospora humi]|uniref:RNA polymerase sigma factor, sigma-70 family n=1 Tax=Micromonospora humi TaxID=745366 RepID=A0A1C5K3U0_9ACTN|nr:sigma-70 family RNA polymerase sigma factor [Micromonospora humi]SCG77428.1 RNA polymerase sigma factor, sigma-70 family [Micromonospora humi]
MPLATPVRPDGLADFLEVRERLLAIAHRIAGRHVDAEDIVQEAWLRWQRVDRSLVNSPPAFLSLTTSRLAISAIRSARYRSSVAPGDWLENVPARGDGPARLAERADDVRAAIEVVATVLTPCEQVTYLLREAFGLPYRQIGAALGRTEPHARQLAYRARLRLAAPRGSTPSTGTPAHRARLLSAFVAAARTGDTAALVALAG